MDDESFRGWTDVRKRIASDERKFVPVVKSQCVHIVRVDDFERAHLVTISTGRSIDEHFVANLHLLERAKESVTVTGDDHISWLPGHGRARNMSEADAQSLRTNPFQNDRREIEIRNLQTADKPAPRLGRSLL
jgi:hypothetical protein